MVLLKDIIGATKCHTLLISCLLTCCVGFAQPAETIGPHVNFSHLDVENGLSQSTVLSIYQDAYGFMWIGTRDGLNRYDTYTFTTYRPEVGDSTTISSHIIHHIAEDDQHQIWAATQNGLSRYNRSSNQFTNYETFHDGTRSPSINSLCIDSKGRIWVGGTFGLLGFDADKEMFYEPHIPFKTYQSFNVNTIKEDVHGNLWIGTDQFGVYRFHPGQKSWTELQISYSREISSRIEDLWIDEGSGLWLGTYGDGLFRVDFSGKVIQHYHQETRGNRHLSNNNIRSLVKDKNGHLWVGTFNGLNILETSGNPTLITYHENNQQGLSHSSIRSLFTDDKGSVWVGTYFGGLNIYDRDNQRFEHFYHLPGNKNSLSFNVVGAFSEDSQGNFYIGTERGGLNIYNPQTRTHKVVPPDSHHNITIKSLCRDRQDNLWLGVFKRGLHLYDPTRKSMQSFPDNQPQYGFLNRAVINHILENDDGELWLATDSRGGIHKFNPRTKKFVDFPHREKLFQLLKYTPVKSIVPLGTDTLVMATKGKGIVFFNLTNGHTETWSTFKTDAHLLHIDEFNHVYLDRKCNLWMASNGAGLLKYDFAEKKFNHYGRNKGLSNNVVQGVLEDKNGDIWAISLNGISKTDAQRYTIIKSYTYSSGLPLTEINEGAFYKTQRDAFLIGGKDGYIRFKPTAIADNRYIPKMAFTALEVKNEPVLPHDDSGVLTRELNQTKKITLTYFQRVLTLEFAALSYLKPQNNRYSYKLEGFDEEWIFTKNKPRVTYTNLSPGDYTFYARGSNNDGIWNNEPLALQIEILPPPWQTGWAYTIYALLIVGGFYVVRRNGIKSTLLKRNLQTEQLEKEKWKEIHDMKLKYFTDVSHEFRTPLTLIAAPLEEILAGNQTSPEERRLAQTMHLNVKKLQLLVDQILDLRALETGHSRLHLQPLNLSYHIREITNSFKVLADKREIKLSLVMKDDPGDNVMADREKLDKIFFNLLSNAFKFTPPGGNIQLEVVTQKRQDRIGFNFALKDTGIGIEPELLPAIFDRFTKKNQDGSGTGIGLALVKSLVELMNGTIRVDSFPGRGTTFVVDIDFDIARQSAGEQPADAGYSPPVPLTYPGEVPPDAEEEALRESRVLVVEDNEGLRSYLKEKLQNSYKVHVARDGREGLEKARKYGADVIISDVMMPKMDGLELCRTVKTSKELCHIPVILLTAKVSQQNKMEGLQTGADAYLPKPFSLEELLLRINNVLNNQQRIRQRYKNLSTPVLSEDQLLNPQDEKLMASTLRIIKDNLDQPNLTVEFLSREVGLSRVHLFRKLKSLTGLTPIEFIRDIRMQNACKLLKTKQYKPSDVAVMTGFQDSKYFGRTFKKFTGITPSEYIKQAGN